MSSGGDRDADRDDRRGAGEDDGGEPDEPRRGRMDRALATAQRPVQLVVAHARPDEQRRPDQHLEDTDGGGQPDVVVAGLKAGKIYNTFPMMGDHWIPPGLMALEPFWRNFFDNTTTVQFDHRLLATLVFASVLILWLATLRQPVSRQVRLGLHAMLAAAVLQVGLRISTLLLQVPVTLASMHQGGALLLLTTVMYLNHRVARSGS